MQLGTGECRAIEIPGDLLAQHPICLGRSHSISSIPRLIPPRICSFLHLCGKPCSIYTSTTMYLNQHPDRLGDTMSSYKYLCSSIKTGCPLEFSGIGCASKKNHTAYSPTHAHTLFHDALLIRLLPVPHPHSQPPRCLDQSPEHPDSYRPTHYPLPTQSTPNLHRC